MSKTEPRVGQRVRVNRTSDYPELKGMKGKIVHIERDDYVSIEYAIEFDETSAKFHDCKGRTGEKRGWWLKEKDFAPATISIKQLDR